MSYLRSRPPWLVAAGVLVLVAVLLGGGLLLTRRPLGAPVPAAAQPTQPPVAAAAQQTALPTPQPTATQQVAVAVTPRPTAAPATATPQPPAPPTATPTPAVLQTLEAVSTRTIAMIHGTPAVVPTFPATATPEPGGGTEWWNLEAPVDPALAAQIEQAYNHFWDVRGEAMYTQDPSRLSDVMDGEVLQNQLNQMDQLRSQGKAEAIIVEHNARVMHASSDEAAVEDEYINHSVDIDLNTKEPVEPPPTDAYVYDYEMRNMQGAWKVVATVRVNYD